jgi:hypothetical protein
MIRTILIGLTLLAVAFNGSLSAQEFSLRNLPDYTSDEKTPQAFAEWDDPMVTGTPAEIDMQKAVLYSLAMPGWGDLYAGHPTRAKVFFATEAAIWTSFIVLRVQGHVREDSYHEFATHFAGLNSTDHSDDFYRTVGEYGSSDAYEADIKREGRAILFYDTNVEALEQYYLDNRHDDFEPWQWSTFDRRVEYRQIRSSSRLSYRRSWYSVAAAAANRIVSAVFAVHAVKSAQSGQDVARNYHLEVGPPRSSSRGDYVTALTLVRKF